MSITVTLPFIGMCLMFIIIDGTLLPIAVLVFAFLHELGHLISMKLCGYKVKRFEVTAVGGNIVCEDDHKSYFRDIIVALSGPLMNFILLVILYKMIGLGFFSKNGMFYLAVNFLLMAVNMLPVSCLDGGRALSAFLSYFVLPDKREHIMYIISLVFSTFLIAGGAYLLYITGFNFSLLLIGVYLTFMLLKVGCK